jgi:hypothetical protein
MFHLLFYCLLPSLNVIANIATTTMRTNMFNMIIKNPVALKLTG